MKLANISGNQQVAYIEEGEGKPIILVHGFASNAQTNWLGPGWMQVLAANGLRPIALDNRGHGQSTKFYAEDDYRLENMADDVCALMDALEIESAYLMGYSMGARISAMFAYKFPQRVEKLILAGNGYNMVGGGFDSSVIRDGLLAESAGHTTTQTGREFRMFAEHTKSDLDALAACIMGARTEFEEDTFRGIEIETLVIIGTEDTVATNGEKLASIMPNARFEPIPKRNHMNAVGDKVYKEKVIAFLEGNL